MQPHPGKASPKLKKEDNDFAGSFPSEMDSPFQEHVDVIPSSDEEEDEGEDDSQTAEDEDSHSYDNASNQLVVYDPEAANGTGGEIEPIPDPINYQPPPYPGNRTSTPSSSRVLPSVGAFTVQCASCFKWRLIPTKEKYEEIREHILENPFVCETARGWRPDISCDDPADIHQDGSRLWAIDKPNIAQPPPGWQRLLRIRGEGSTKFADVYYVAPSGKRLRSMVEIHRYLYDHPEYSEAVQPSQFSFQIPKPLQENYVRKRPARLTALDDGNHLGVSRPLEPSEVNPIAWAGPADSTDLQLGGPGLSAPYFEAPVFEPVGRPSKKQARSAPSKQMYSNQAHNQHKVKVEEPHQSINDDYGL